jgi:microcystin-dependent protein
MSCSNCPPEACFNGCVDITADACVRYTGNDSEELGISTGDSLLTVENILIEKVVSFLDGTGIDITINPSYYCTLVSQYLVGITVPTVPQLFSALVRAACSLQTQVTAINGTLAILNADYDVDCLSGVTDSSDTHAVLQAVITKLCVVEADLAALTLDLDTNYVKLADLDALIAAYLASQAGGPTQQSSKMVPFVAYEYYGSLSNFDGTGAGIPGNGFNDVYLCNGLNGTPDKRGRVAVGAIANVPPVGIGLASAVNPAIAGNPNYALSGTAGANSIVLTSSQLPAHSHNALGTATVTLNDPGHSHYVGNTPEGWSSSGSIGIVDRTPTNVQTTTATTGITVTSNTANNVSITVESTGDNVAHSNIQPVIAAYYIMYIP